FPNEGVLVFTSLRGILYNSNLVPKEKAPKSYEDLVDSRLSPTWAGKLAIPPYVSWLVELSMIWSEERVKNFTRKLVTLSGGRLRYGEEERIVSGEFPIAANMGGAVEGMWKGQAKRAPLVARIGSTPGRPSYFQFGWPKNSGHSNLAKLFVAFVASKDGQAILEKHESVSSHLVEGTKMAKYLRDTKLALQPPKDSIAFYLKGEDRSATQRRNNQNVEAVNQNDGILESWNIGVVGKKSEYPSIPVLHHSNGVDGQV